MDKNSQIADASATPSDTNTFAAVLTNLGDYIYHVFQMKKPPTLRQIATRAGVGLAATSLALRNARGVSAETKALVQKVAREMGWRPDPLVSAFQMRLRASRPVHYRATIGWIDDHREPDFWQRHSEVLAAQKRAADLGFVVDIIRIKEIRLDSPTETAARFQRILRARGIDGVILPRLDRAHLVGEDWPGFAVVSLGHNSGLMAKNSVRSREDCPFHEVDTDAVANFQLAVKTLRSKGYIRIGLVVSEWHDSLNLGVFLALMLRENFLLRPVLRLPPLVLKNETPWPQREKQFKEYLRRHNPEAILISNLETLQWCRDMGLHPPKDIALAHLELDDEDEILSGIDPRRRLQAEAAVDLVTAQMVRNERDPPPFQKRLLIGGVWRDAGTA